MSLRLSDFDIDAERGFLPSPDLPLALPGEFAAWDTVATQLPLLIMTGRLRPTLAAMPVLDVSKLTASGDEQRAMLILAGFANAWMANAWMDKSPVPDRIPAPIAVPLIALSRKLDRPPISTHGTIVLLNWRRLDPGKPLSLDNVDTILSFRGSIDEKWFFLATAGVEMVGAAAMVLLAAAVDASVDGDVMRMADHLATIATVTQSMTAAFMRIRESCDPYIFYTHVRPYLAGWPQSGVVYDGTDVGPVSYSGASAAQSALLQAIDAGLGIAHRHAHTESFLLSMRAFMPPRHRAFIEALAAQSRVRERVLAAGAPSRLTDAYDACVNAMDELRRKHIGLVTEYITRQMPPGASAVGTGGTSFDDFLRQARLETVQSLTRRHS